MYQHKHTSPSVVTYIVIVVACTGIISGQDKVSEVSDLVNDFIDDIYKFWITYGPDEEFGGFYTQVDQFGVPSPNEPKNIIMIGRQLYVASIFFLKNRYPSQDRQKLVKEMNGLFDWMKEYLYDPDDKEFFYSVSFDGSNVVDGEKRAYYTAFAIWGLSYYSMAAKKIGDTERSQSALSLALEAYQSLHNRLYDAEFGGYDQSRESNWFGFYSGQFQSNLGKSSKGSDTQMHLLEALTALYTASKDSFVAKMLGEQLDIFVNILFKDRDYLPIVTTRNWTSLTDHIVYGHNIEVVHLIQEAAKALEYSSVSKSEVDSKAFALAKYVQANGFDRNLGCVYRVGIDGVGVTNFEKTWWVQAEASLGFWRAYQISNDQTFLDDLLKILQFYSSFQAQSGEFFNRKNNPTSNLFYQWKASYHNIRAFITLADEI